MASTSTTAADEAGTSGEVAVRPRRALEELWDETFVRDLPADPRSDNIPRQVLHAWHVPRPSPTSSIWITRSQSSPVPSPPKSITTSPFLFTATAAISLNNSTR